MSKKGSVLGKEKEKEKEVIVLDKKGEEKRHQESQVGKKKCCQ